MNIIFNQPLVLSCYVLTTSLLDNTGGMCSTLHLWQSWSPYWLFCCSNERIALLGWPRFDSHWNSLKELSDGVIHKYFSMNMGDNLEIDLGYPWCCFKSVWVISNVDVFEMFVSVRSSKTTAIIGKSQPFPEKAVRDFNTRSHALTFSPDGSLFAFCNSNG